MICDTCEQSRSIHPEHDRGDRFSVTLIFDPADEDGNAALIALLEDAEWAGQVKADPTDDDPLAEFEFTVGTEEIGSGDDARAVLTVVGLILDTDDFATTSHFDFQATPTGGGDITFLGGSTITVIGDVTRVTGS